MMSKLISTGLVAGKTSFKVISGKDRKSVV